MGAASSQSQGGDRALADREARLDRTLLAFFLASGAAALIYEVVWFHLLRLVIGASALSLGILLASFMGGMCLGSLLLPRLVHPGRQPLRVYAGLEIGIGGLGLLLLVALPAARQVYLELFGYGAMGIALRAAIAGVLLLPPTALMGATLPAIARRYPASAGGMSKLGLLYGANTIGAVLGCLAAGFLLLPRFDVGVATGVAAALNFAIGAGALWLARGSSHAAPAPQAPAPPPPGAAAAPVFLAVALSGLTALGAQVVWTRLLSLLFGGTTYTFAIILAVFLAGLGIGSVLAASALRRGFESRSLLAGSQLLLVPALLYAGWVMAQVTPYSSPLRIAPVASLHVLNTFRCLEAILPATLLWGASFPLALAAASAGRRDTGRSSGHVYAANTIGAILGALLVTFAGVPLWGTRGSQAFLIGAAGVSAAALYLAGATGPRRESVSAGAVPVRAASRALVALSLGAALVGVLLTPGFAPQFLAHGRYVWRIGPGQGFPFIAEGITSTVAVSTRGSHRYFHVSGKIEASTERADMRLQRLLGNLSALAHERPRRVLIVGLGAGVTAGSFVLHPEVERIVICEIEPRVVVAASRFFSDVNHDVLSDPRVEVIFDDARHFLTTSHEQFDVITSDPIHPWVRGNSVLFSKEYYEIVRQRLAPGGLATQWVPLYETSRRAIKIQMRTFFDAFPGGTVWNSQERHRGYDVVLLGQARPARLDLGAIQGRIDANARLRQSLAEVGLGSALDLLASFAVGAGDLGSWLEGTPVNRDRSLKLEYISGLALNAMLAGPIYRSMIQDRSLPGELFAGPPAALEELERRIAQTR